MLGLGLGLGLGGCGLGLDMCGLVNITGAKLDLRLPSQPYRALPLTLSRPTEGRTLSSVGLSSWSYTETIYPLGLTVTHLSTNRARR